MREFCTWGPERTEWAHPLLPPGVPKKENGRQGAGEIRGNKGPTHTAREEPAYFRSFHSRYSARLHMKADSAVSLVNQ